MKTVKVRAAVAVDSDGNWSVSGWKGAEDETVMDIATEMVDPGETRFWLTAELPIPEVPEIQAAFLED